MLHLRPELMSQYSRMFIILFNYYDLNESNVKRSKCDMSEINYFTIHQFMLCEIDNTKCVDLILILSQTFFIIRIRILRGSIISFYDICVNIMRFVDSRLVSDSLNAVKRTTSLILIHPPVKMPNYSTLFRIFSRYNLEFQ